MATVGVKGRRKEDYCEYVVGPLWLRVGMVFERGKAPKNAEGMFRHPVLPDAKWEKFYFPETGINLLEKGVSYEVPPYIKGAHHGELLLSLQGKSNEAREQIVFGRFGEEVPFQFNDESSFLPLWIMPEEKREFNPLYIRHNQPEEGPDYFVLMIEWVDDVISLVIDSVDLGAEEVPPHLVSWQPQATVG